MQQLDIDLVIARLKAQVPTLRVVDDGISLDQIQDLRGHTHNSAYVVLDKEQPTTEDATHTTQVVVRFVVVIAARSSRPADLRKESSALINACRQALHNWRPDGREFHRVTWTGGEVLDYDKSVLLWIDSFKTTYFV